MRRSIASRPTVPKAAGRQRVRHDMMEVGILKDVTLRYACPAPFHPAGDVPECAFDARSETNLVYAAVRALFRRMGLDRANFGLASWNPLGDIVKPGDSVVLKPNLVRHCNPRGGMECMVTHGSVIRAVLDYVHAALKGEGTIVIGDAPIQSCDFDKVADYVGLHEIADLYRDQGKIDIAVEDFRLVRSQRRPTGLISRERLGDDSDGHVAVDMQDESELTPIASDFDKFRVTGYDRQELAKHHNLQKHEYLVSKRVLEADVIINLPKLKTHRKAGMTCAMKNLVGINGHKDWLPHHRAGSESEGGDEYLHKSARKSLERMLWEKRDVCTSSFRALSLEAARLAVYCTGFMLPHKDPYREGNWYGNDTTPRMVADLNRIVSYADKTGKLQDGIQRRMVVVVDGIVAGEREGPLAPSPKHCGLLVAGFSPVLVDVVCAELMGLDRAKIPTLKYALKPGRRALLAGRIEDLTIASDQCDKLADVYATYGEDFVPSRGWLGHIERE